MRDVVSLTGWLFFVLLYAYYSGALTMFFTSEPSVPFDTRREGMRMYPDWELIIIEGNHHYYEEKARSGDPDFSGTKAKS